MEAVGGTDTWEICGALCVVIDNNDQCDVERLALPVAILFFLFFF